MQTGDQTHLNNYARLLFERVMIMLILCPIRVDSEIFTLEFDLHLITQMCCARRTTV